MSVNDIVNIEAVKNWWLRLSRRYYELQRQIEPLFEERNRVNELRASLAQVLTTAGINVHELEASFAEEAPSEQPPEGPKVSDLAYEILEAKAKPAHYKEILSAINERGFHVPGNDPATNLLSHMLKDKRIVKAPEVGRGYYKLKKWDTPTL